MLQVIIAKNFIVSNTKNRNDNLSNLRS